MKKVLVRNLFTFALAIASSQLYAVTWVHHKYETSAGWSGGSEIDGYTSYSDTWSYDSGTPTHYFHTNGFPVRINTNIEEFVLDNPPGSADILGSKFGMSYNGLLYPSGDPDPSIRDFHVRRTSEMVFSTTGVAITNGGRSEQIAPFQYALLEKGTYSGGVFTPTSTVMNLLTDSYTIVGGGYYRFKTSFDSGTFTESAGFFRSNNIGMYLGSEAVPEPVTFVAAALGLASLSRRRRRNGTS